MTIKKLMDDLPNKIVQQLGLIVDIDLHEKENTYLYRDHRSSEHRTYFLSWHLPLPERKHQAGAKGDSVTQLVAEEKRKELGRYSSPRCHGR